MRLNRFLYPLLFALAFLLSNHSIAQRSGFFFSTVKTAEVPSSFDADYQAVLDYATLQGYTLPSAGQQILQNQIVLDLKAEGIWTLLDILYIFATDGDSDFATLNWKDPTVFQCTMVNSPTFTADVGFTANGTTSYLNTGFDISIDAVNYTLTDASAFVDEAVALSLSSSQNFGAGIAISTEALRLNVANSSSGGTFAGLINSNSTTVNALNPDSRGFYLLQRITNTSSGYKNGVFIDDVSGAATGLPVNAVTVFAFNANTGAEQFRESQSGIFGLGGSLTGKELGLYTAWNTYKTSL